MKEEKTEIVTRVCFILETPIHRKLKIHSILNTQGDLNKVWGSIVRGSKELKNIYTPIKGLKKIDNWRDKEKGNNKNWRVASLLVDDDLHKKLQVMVVINNITISQLANWIIVKNHEEWLKQNET